MIAYLSIVSSQSTPCFSTTENNYVSISCSTGQIITAINFASYGTPTGTCGAYATSSCHAGSSNSVVYNACINRVSCSIGAKNNIFGDPCGGTSKRLYVQVTCSGGNSPGPTYGPTNIPSIIPTTVKPTSNPSANPSTSSPTGQPTATPSCLPTAFPSSSPSVKPTNTPSSSPTAT